MKVYVMPADSEGCGHHRLIWPAQVLQEAGHDVVIDMPRPDRLKAWFWKCTAGHDHGKVEYPPDADVIVMQRVTDLYLVETIKLLREYGVAVVIDVDDDLDAIDPGNPAWGALHPSAATEDHPHSWRATGAACREATLVTVSTPALLDRYARHGRGVVLHNYLADHYYAYPHRDSDWIAWPGSMRSHPNDPQVTRGAVGRLVGEGCKFRVIGNPGGTKRAFNLPEEPHGTGSVDLVNWPRALAIGAGIGLVPLADTRFNAAKSWLKGLELAACGVPFVASPVTEYRKLHQMGAGLLAKDRLADWYRPLRRLVNDEGYRRELSERGRAVAETLRLRDHAWRHWEAWEAALKIQRDSSPGIARTSS